MQKDFTLRPVSDKCRNDESSYVFLFVPAIKNRKMYERASFPRSSNTNLNVKFLSLLLGGNSSGWHDVWSPNSVYEFVIQYEITYPCEIIQKESKTFIFVFFLHQFSYFSD